MTDGPQWLRTALSGRCRLCGDPIVPDPDDPPRRRAYHQACAAKLLAASLVPEADPNQEELFPDG